ncbi:MAG: bifunctional DNA primase/polymerase [Pirellulales bacterium]
MSGLLEAALRYAELGYPVFPCVGGRKAPLTPNGFHDATTIAEQIETWWQRHPTANIAIPTAGLVVIDVDGPANAWLTDNPERLGDLLIGAVASTPGGGKHYIFRAPDGAAIRCRTGQIASKVDVRAEGGYILVPPSRVGGKPYQFAPGLELDQPRDQLPKPPAWLLSQLVDDAQSSPTSPRVATSAAESNTIPSGQRNATLARLGGNMRRVGMSRDEILAALVRANADRCSPPLPAAEVERIAASVARYEPDQVSVALAEDHWSQDFTPPPAADAPPSPIVDPGPLPAELLRVPGFVSEVMDYCLETAPYPNQALAFCGALPRRSVSMG